MTVRTITYRIYIAGEVEPERDGRGNTLAFGTRGEAQRHVNDMRKMQPKVTREAVQVTSFVDEPAKPAYADCPDCGETASVPPPVSRPAVVLNPSASDEAILSAPSAASVCIACDAVVHFVA